MIRSDSLARGIACALCVALFGSQALAQFNSPGMPPPAKAAAAASFLLGANAPSVSVRLDAIDPMLIDAARRENMHAKRLQVGVGREVDARAQAEMESLLWATVPDGMAARFEVTSAGARALRVALPAARIAPGMELRFAGSGSATVYGPFTSRDVDTRAPTYWSPVLEGDTAVVELFVSGNASVVDRAPVVTEISHLFVSPSDPRADSLAKALGDSAFCEVNLICRSASDPALASAGRAVARMVYTAGRDSFSCTGTLLNPKDGSFTPYFYSAAHCIGSQIVANTVATTWFYDSPQCDANVTVQGGPQQLTGGATLLYSDEGGGDALLLRLNKTPPTGAVWAGWDAAIVANGTPLVAIHHPKGDIKKVSLGTMGGFNGGIGSPTSGDTFLISKWNSIATGVTEKGSSGSGIFTAVGSPASEYRLRGGLQGGPSSCTARDSSTLQDYYSRLDVAFPSIAKYLDAASPPPANYTAMWWEPKESGWGINLAHQGDTVFATLFTYDLKGQPMWLVSTMSKTGSDPDVYSGSLLQTTGPAFNANPVTPIDGSNVTTVGTIEVALTGNDGGLSYSVNGVNVSKSITKQLFEQRLSTCIGTIGDRSGLANYQDLWWAGQEESGWGVNLTHQGDTIFASLFTYQDAGQGTRNPGLWLVATTNRQRDGSFTGDLLRTTGPPFNADPFTPIGGDNVTTVGTMRFRFTDGKTGTMTYTVNGITVSKSITRQVFGSPRPACNS